MELYLLKHNMIYFICNCPKEIIIPTNDFEAYDFFKKFQNLYNKKWIAESQNISCGLQKTEPKQFPVIIRPIKNLQGMGRDAYYADKIPKNMSKDHFWCEILKGDHISVDVFFNKYGIQGIIAFQGFPGKLFTFKYWEYLPKYKLPKTIKVWINTHLKSFKGVFNLEMISIPTTKCTKSTTSTNTRITTRYLCTVWVGHRRKHSNQETHNR